MHTMFLDLFLLSRRAQKVAGETEFKKKAYRSNRNNNENNTTGRIHPPDEIQAVNVTQTLKA